MSEQTLDAAAEVSSTESEDFAAERSEQVERFVKTSPGYYREQFARIGSDSKFVRTFNFWAGILGPVWFCARGMWNWGLSFLILETMAVVQFVRGLFGDLASEAWERIAKIEGTLELRRQQLAPRLKTIPTRSTSTDARWNRWKKRSAAFVWKPSSSRARG